MRIASSSKTERLCLHPYFILLADYLSKRVYVGDGTFGDCFLTFLAPGGGFSPLFFFPPPPPLLSNLETLNDEPNFKSIRYYLNSARNVSGLHQRKINKATKWKS